MVGAGLLKAVERGLERQPGQDLAGPGLDGGDHLRQAGLDEYLDRLGFNLVERGCTTCIVELGLASRRRSRRSSTTTTWSSAHPGQPELRGPHQPGRPQQLPGFAAAVRRVRAGRPDGHRHPGGPARRGHRRRAGSPARPLADERGDQAGRRRRRALRHVHQELRGRVQGRRALGRPRHPDGDRYTWPDSTYVRKPSFFEGMDSEPKPVQPISGARVLAVLGDSVTTDHISPAGAIKKASPPGSG